MKLKLLAVSLLVVASWAGSLWSEGWLPAFDARTCRKSRRNAHSYACTRTGMALQIHRR